jgi:hypothetical protein
LSNSQIVDSGDDARCFQIHTIDRIHEFQASDVNEKTVWVTVLKNAQTDNQTNNEKEIAVEKDKKMEERKKLEKDTNNLIIEKRRQESNTQEKQNRLLDIEFKYNQICVSNEQSQDAVKRMEYLLNERLETEKEKLKIS